jgi:plasmid stabilization system protein ParE
MKVEWSEAALSDLNRFARFLEDRFPAMAKVVARELVVGTKILAENPRLGRSFGRRPEFRQIVLRVLNASYVVQYRLMNDGLVILRVYHARELRDR